MPGFRPPTEYAITVFGAVFGDVTTESLLQRVGGFGLYQKLVLIFTSYALLCWGVFSLVFYFLIAEPRWKCVENSIVCNLTETVGPGEIDYDYRCGIARQEWTFVDDYTSLITQVMYKTFINHRLMLTLFDL